MNKVYRGAVVNVSDPKSQGRVKVKIAGFCSPDLGVGQNYPRADITAWCHGCSPFAGNGYGLFCLPKIGDTAILAPMENGEFIIMGYQWTGTQAKPSEGNADTRVFKTPAGHRLQFAEGGDILIHSSGGAEIKVRANGNIELNGAAGKLVTTKMICAYTGKEHPQGLGSVKAG
ncbi:MAG: phage baseplate assembly protein V [Candidatus Zixiibacteriota bacterium]